MRHLRVGCYDLIKVKPKVVSADRPKRYHWSVELPGTGRRKCIKIVESELAEVGFKAGKSLA